MSGMAAPQSLIARFEEQVNRIPDATALTVEDGRSFTYRQLNTLSESLSCYIAHTIDELSRRNETTSSSSGGGGESDTPLVTIMMNRDVGFIAGMLAILKAGAAYVPVDPAFPPDRQSYIFKHSRCSLALLDEDCMERARKLGVDLPATITVSSKEGTAVPPSQQLLVFPSNIQSRENAEIVDSLKVKRADALKRLNGGLAYVLYTSGSTGLPKGVMVKQEGVTNIIDWFAGQLDMSVPGKKVLGLTTFCFDISVLEMFMPLLHGANLVLAFSSTQKDTFRLLEILEDYHIDVLQATPTTFEMMIAAGWTGDLRVDLLIGGEAFRPTLLPLAANSRSIRNVYGPTETTIWSSSYTVPRDIMQTTHSPSLSSSSKPPPIPIGAPISSTDFYLATEADVTKLAPSGEEGELCIGGIGVALGYLNAPDLTQGRFISCPYPGGQGMIYRTGDIVKKLENSDSYVFVRRMDDQVKIGGFRIELAEIEQVYMENETIEQAVALVRNGALVIYLKAAPGKSLGSKEQQAVKDLASRKLTYYMVPKDTVVVSEFPQTANGKLDKKALPDPPSAQVLEIEKTRGGQNGALTLSPQANDLRVTSTTKAPIGGGKSIGDGTLVSRICDIIEEVKGQRPRRTANFSSMGVDSIGAIIFIKKLSENLGGIRISAGTVFAPETTIQSFSETIEKRLRAEKPEVLVALGVTTSFEEDIENHMGADATEVRELEDGDVLDDPVEEDFGKILGRHKAMFEGLRGIFTFLVLFDHYHRTTDYQTADARVAEEYLCVYCLKSDVIFFFILSGFTTALQLRIPVKHEVVIKDGVKAIQIKPRTRLDVINFLVTRFVGLFPILWIGLILNAPIWYKQDLKAASVRAGDPGIVPEGSKDAQICEFLYVIGMQSWWRPQCHYVGPNTMVYASEVINIIIIYIITRYGFDLAQNYLMSWSEKSLCLLHDDFSEETASKFKSEPNTRTWKQFIGNEVTRFAYNRLDFWRASISSLFMMCITFGIWAVYYSTSAFTGAETQNPPQFLGYFIGGVVAASVMEMWNFALWTPTRARPESCPSLLTWIVTRCLPDTIASMTLFIYVFTSKWTGLAAQNPAIRFDPNTYSKPSKGGVTTLLWWVILPMALFLYLVFVLQQRNVTFFKRFFELPCFTWIGYISYPTYLLQAVFFEFYAPSLYLSQLKGHQVWVHQYDGMYWFYKIPVGAKVICTFLLFIICFFVQYVVQDTLVIYLYAQASAFLSKRCLSSKGSTVNISTNDADNHNDT